MNYFILTISILCSSCIDTSALTSGTKDLTFVEYTDMDMYLQNEDANTVDFDKDMTQIDQTGQVDDLIKPPHPSCANLPSTCGPNKNEDCCAAPMVPGGTFNRSNDPMYPATISAFQLDRFEVTVGRFRAFITAGMGTQKNPPAAGSGAAIMPGTGWDAAWNMNLPADAASLQTALKCDVQATWTDAAGVNENKPINCIDWYEAFAFCIWDGGRLPTEAEWNFAAAGGDEQRAYPWSTGPMDITIDPSYAVYGGAAIGEVGSKSPKGDSKWGQADLAGNVLEFILDWYIIPYPIKTCANCAYITSGDNRVYRGGNWRDPTTGLLTYGRGAGQPGARANIIGTRCSR